MGERKLQPVGFGRMAFVGSRLGYAYGHHIVTDKDGVTRYCDDLSVLDRDNLRPCTKCGLDPNDYDGHDPCIANLPGVRNACCGHGVDDAYIEFNDGRVVIGKLTIHNEYSRHPTPMTETSDEQPKPDGVQPRLRASDCGRRWGILRSGAPRLPQLCEP